MARAPGWYPHPDQRQMLRWWDGTAWTGHIAAEPPAGSPPPPAPDGLSWPESDQTSTPTDRPWDQPVDRPRDVVPPSPPPPPPSSGSPETVAWPSPPPPTSGPPPVRLPPGGELPTRQSNPLAVIISVVLVIVGVLIAIGLGVGVFSGPDEDTAKQVLRDIAAAQELHHAATGSYAATLTQLGVDVDSDVDAVIARATDRGFCAEASLEESTRVWRWDTRFGTVEEGRCPV